jgi:ABC-type dipeptide/oligopeptide/nickel transport system permease component
MARRLALGVLAVLSVTVLLFAIMQAMPGDPVRMIADPRMPAHHIEALRARWGLDRPLYVQYFVWLSNIATGDMGTSILTRRPVAELIGDRLPYTLALAGCALVLQYVVGITVGLLVAVRRGSWADRVLEMTAIVFRSIPGYLLAIILMIAFALHWRLFPISGYEGPISLVLPVLSLSLPTLADTMRLTRSEVLDILGQQFVTAARAKGLPEPWLLVKHVLRNALIPVTVLFFLSLPWLIGGAVVVESVFAWPGMGRLLWRSILSQDLPVVQGVVFIIAVLTAVSNAMGDILTAALDPRIREGYRRRR